MGKSKSFISSEEKSIKPSIFCKVKQKSFPIGSKLCEPIGKFCSKVSQNVIFSGKNREFFQILIFLYKSTDNVKIHFLSKFRWKILIFEKTVPFCDTLTILWQSWTILWQTKLDHFVTPIVPFCVKKKLDHFLSKSDHCMNYEFLLENFRKFHNFRSINGNFYLFYTHLTLNRSSSCKINTTLSRDQFLTLVWPLQHSRLRSRQWRILKILLGHFSVFHN